MGTYLRWVALLSLAVAAVALLASCASSNASTSKGGSSGATVNGPRISVPEESFDFGKVPLDKIVSHAFIIKNVGSTNLAILGEPPVRAVQGC